MSLKKNRKTYKDNIMKSYKVIKLKTVNKALELKQSRLIHLSTRLIVLID